MVTLPDKWYTKDILIKPFHKTLNGEFEVIWNDAAALIGIVLTHSIFFDCNYRMSPTTVITVIFVITTSLSKIE